ncbi:helicase [Clostridium sp.]|uniref:helicase n=1 Tax=Clostridium sp. TaxID=1506 RepID=UPI002608384B|nr:helicase [Clostridium sp.]
MVRKKTETVNIDIDKKELEAISKIKDYRLIVEANIVSILWKHPDLYYNYENLTIKNFIHNEWKVFFQIGYDIIIKEKKQTLDEITVNLYLEKHLKLKEKYEEYGGYSAISKTEKYVKEQNIDGYIAELNKWEVVINLSKNKFPIADRLAEYVDLTAEEIYDEYEAMLNHIFINVDGDDKTYTIGHDIDKLIDELDEGLAIGLPYYNSPILTHETGGDSLGNITLVGGLSGAGKTTLSRTLKLPSIIENNEKICCLLNEESIKKWQRELLIWVANNIYKQETKKYKLRDGKFSPEFKDFLKNKCAKWIKDHNDQIIIKPFKHYSTDKAIKCIKKYAHLGVKYFILDTYKADSNTSNSEAFWFNLQQNMVKIYDVIKEESLNVHILITFQLAKSSSRQRCYTQDNIGMAKNIVDVASTCIMVRKLYDDEYEGEKHELKVFRFTGKNNKTKIPVTLDKNKHYQILFIVKNREGSSNEYSIVVEHDMSTNTYREIGLTVIAPDF